MDNCTEVVRPAVEAALDSYSIESDQHFCRVTTPFQRPNGDLVTVWIRRDQGDTYEITDRGETIAMLRMYGVNPATGSREKHLERLKAQFGVAVAGSEIQTTCSEAQLGESLRNVVQAALGVSDLSYTHETKQPSRFKKEVMTFLDGAGYDFTEGFGVTGTTQERTFDFGINSREPQVLLDTIHSSTRQYLKQQVDSVLLNWHEITDTSYQHGAVIDNVNGEADEDVLESLEENLNYYFMWSDQQEILDAIPVTV